MSGMSNEPHFFDAAYERPTGFSHAGDRFDEADESVKSMSSVRKLMRRKSRSKSDASASTRATGPVPSYQSPFGYDPSTMTRTDMSNQTPEQRRKKWSTRKSISVLDIAKTSRTELSPKPPARSKSFNLFDRSRNEKNSAQTDEQGAHCHVAEKSPTRDSSLNILQKLKRNEPKQSGPQSEMSINDFVVRPDSTSNGSSAKKKSFTSVFRRQGSMQELPSGSFHGGVGEPSKTYQFDNPQFFEASRPSPDHHSYKSSRNDIDTAMNFFDEDNREEFNSSNGSGEVSNVTENFRMRSSESEPSNHQLQIPSARSFLKLAQICALMESYSILRASAQDFDFASLAGKSRGELEAMHAHILTTIEANPTAFSNGHDTWCKDDTSSVPHPSILKSLFECGGDIVVQGYFTANYSAQCQSLEVTVFSSQQDKRFTVCYRGTPEQQAKPISQGKSPDTDALHASQPIKVKKDIRDCYFAGHLEQKIFRLVEKLAGRNPSFDVVTTGHSFGGALAIMGAVRFASVYPMLTVSCHAYGAPRIGGMAFRQYANSLPNLKVVRVENGGDPYVSLPDGSKWAHSGHTISIREELLTSSSKSKKSTSQANAHSQTSNTVTVAAFAYRFDEKRPAKPLLSNINSKSRTKQMRQDHEVRSYVQAIQKFTHLGFPWVSTFVCDGGDTGIEQLNQGSDRCVV